MTNQSEENNANIKEMGNENGSQEAEVKVTQDTPFENGSDDESINGKPNHSYISLIANAILSSPEKRLVLSDIYQYVIENFTYFRNKGAGWRNSIRHNLSLNECFIKAGRSPNGKGHFWAINPANYDDFSKGDFRRRRAQRRARRAMAFYDVPEQHLPQWYHPYFVSANCLANSSIRHYSAPSYRAVHSPELPLQPYTVCTREKRRFSCPQEALSKNKDIKKPKRPFDVESLLKDDGRKKDANKQSKAYITSYLTSQLPSPIENNFSNYYCSTKRKDSELYPNFRISDLRSPAPGIIPFQRYRTFCNSAIPTNERTRDFQDNKFRVPYFFS